jgi:hypothetical protein
MELTRNEALINVTAFVSLSGQYSALLYTQVPGVMEQIICTLVSLLRKTTHWKAHLNQICKLELYLHWKHVRVWGFATPSCEHCKFQADELILKVSFCH